MTYPRPSDDWVRLALGAAGTDPIKKLRTAQSLVLAQTGRRLDTASAVADLAAKHRARTDLVANRYLGSRGNAPDWSQILGLSGGSHRLQAVATFAKLVGTPDHEIGMAFANVQTAQTASFRAAMIGLTTQSETRQVAQAALLGPLLQQFQIADGLSSVARLLGKFDHGHPPSSVSAGLSSYFGAHNTLSELTRRDEKVLLRGLSVPATTKINAYLDSLTARSVSRRFDLATRSADSSAGLLFGEALVTTEQSDDIDDELISIADSQLIEPWQEASDSARRDLFLALEALDPHLSNLLKGAWFSIHADAPAAAVSAATCLVEVLDQTLHHLADGDALRTWLAANDLAQKPAYVDVKTDRPTRRARVAFAVRTRSRRDSELVHALETSVVAALAPLRSALESAKHGRSDVGVHAVRCHAVAVESLLMTLLLQP